MSRNIKVLNDDELNYINKGHITEEEFNSNPHKYFIKDNNFYK